ncbi:hypothetical protein [Lichenibacterium ramalinae]|uniref:Uncharacterized protein n=1 Tax=Lichenibacterium ramalinae TaxID=2316527 RepID=A0A4Q2RDD2_9HYPH|nr:hypothetical protein [Lichenibacterium ramalinae]RYB05725.1 hypothetical protein D3272_09075 [Lichenibacterium ramalinae]
MGEVVSLNRPDAVDPRFAEWVRTLCFFAGEPDRADGYLARGTSCARIVAELRTAMAGRRGREGEAAYLAQLRGPHRPQRHALPIHPQPHGFRRRPNPRK